MKNIQDMQNQEADSLSWLDSYNVIWNTPSENGPAASMPCGGHSIGCNVWVQGGELLVYMQRSGSFDENNEYLKLGRLRFRLTPDPFEDAAVFKQRLDLRHGCVEISAGQATIRIWVETSRPVIHVDIDARRETSVDAAFECWRNEEKILDNATWSTFLRPRFGCYSWDCYPGEVRRYPDTVTPKKNGVIFHHRNREDRLLFDFIVKQQHLETVRERLVNTQRGRTFGGYFTGDGFENGGLSDGIFLNTPYKAWHLRSETPRTEHHLRVFTHVAQTESLEDWNAQLDRLVEEKLSDAHAWEETCRWWAEFWNRSRIVVRPQFPKNKGQEKQYKNEDSIAWRMACNYQLMRYQLGCNVLGEFPTKFNGGNFVFDYGMGPDFRAWGGGSFTAQNQRLLHWPMLKSGDADLMLPQFEFYRRALPSATARVENYWGHGGCCFTEQMENFGLPVASAWGWSVPEAKCRRRGPELSYDPETDCGRMGPDLPFGDSRVDGNSDYGTPVEHGIQANAFVSYHWEAQLEFSYMILEHRRFFGSDISPYLEFIDQSVRFFDEHYQKRAMIRSGRALDENGKLVIWPIASLESYRGARNPADIVAGLNACLEGLLALDDALLNPEQRKYYRGYLKRIPDYPYGEAEGKRVMKPAECWIRPLNNECSEFYPMFPFNQFSLEDDSSMEMFRHSWKHATFPKDQIQCWRQDGVFYARMGMTEEAADYNSRKLGNPSGSEFRFPTFWGTGDWVPDHNWGGSGMIGLQEMLMQTPGRSILLLPAWPMEWDVDFKLHAPYETIVQGKVSNGKLVELTVTPEERRKDITICYLERLSKQSKV